ncbi:unnamed protein product [Onchocerca ochengi]|uniref:ZP domain-containing protein n=1 Tax=Onchocerca ochengi TaxID=42157 RepID=A0A182EQG1_ONCOC|nr:unnamed protein product [Onchocerca ochengi]
MGNVYSAVVYIIRVSSLARDARIGHCWARDDQSTLQLSDNNGCSVQLIGNVWNHFQRQEDGNSIIFRNQIKAWAFPTSNDVNIFCNLHTCRITCHRTSCKEQRQRRNVMMVNDADYDNNTVHIIKTNFHVQDKRKEMEKNEDKVLYFFIYLLLDSSMLRVADPASP